MSGWIAWIAGWLIGGIQISPWLVRKADGAELTATGSGNLGATNALRTAGPKVAAWVFLIDALKGLAAVGVTQLAIHSGWLQPLARQELWGESFVLWLAAFGAVLGHIFPWSHRLRGGKGVATAAGALVLLSPLTLAGSFLLFAALVGWSHRVSLGSLAAAVVLPVLGIATGATPWGSASFLIAVLLASAITFAHRGNIGRLLSGTEPAISVSSKPSAGESAQAQRNRRKRKNRTR